jgi:putative peptidoglycan lipid II flippase
VATALRRIGADEGSEAPAMSLATSGLSAEAVEHSLLTSPPRQVRPALEPDAAGRAALPAPVSDPADLNPARAERRWLRRALVSVAIALGIGVFLLSLDLLAANRVPDLDGDSGAPGGAASDEQGFSEPDAQPAPPPEALTERPIVRAADYDPYGNGTENADRTSLAIDSDVGTVWPTQVYYDPLELQKPGVGVLLDLGRPVEVASVDLVLAGAPSDVSVLLTPPDAQQVPPTPDGLVEFGTVSAAPESVTVMGQPQRSRYVLVWYTRLPQVPDGWRGGVAEVVVRG